MRREEFPEGGKKGRKEGIEKDPRRPRCMQPGPKAFKSRKDKKHKNRAR